MLKCPAPPLPGIRCTRGSKTTRPSPCARTAHSTASMISALDRPSASMSGPERNLIHRSRCGRPLTAAARGAPAPAAASGGHAGAGARGSGLRHLVQEDVPDGGRVDAGNVLGRRGEVVVEVPEDDRGLLEQQGLDLPGDLLLGGQLNGGDVLP